MIQAKASTSSSSRSRRRRHVDAQLAQHGAPVSALVGHDQQQVAGARPPRRAAIAATLGRLRNLAPTSGSASRRRPWLFQRPSRQARAPRRAWPVSVSRRARAGCSPPQPGTAMARTVPPACQRVAEDGEFAPRHDVARSCDLHAEAQVGLVVAVARHRLGVASGAGKARS